MARDQPYFGVRAGVWPVAFASFLCPLAVASHRVEDAAGLASSAGRELEPRAVTRSRDDPGTERPLSL
jgi:hypothetical protein